MRFIPKFVLVVLVSVFLGLIGIPATMTIVILDRLPAQEVVQPPVYAFWWWEVQYCSQTPAQKTLPRVYIIDQPSFHVLRWELIGVYDQWRNRIYVTRDEALSARTMRHEMLHALGWMHHSRGYKQCGLD